MAVQNRTIPLVFHFGAVAAADTFEAAVDLGKIRIKRVSAVSEVAEAAHATQVLRIQVGTVADPDRYADLTNDTDSTSSAVTAPAGVIVSSAWAADTVKALDYDSKTAGNAPDVAAPGTPGGSYPEHSGTLLVTCAKAAGTTTGRVTVVVEYFYSD